MKPILFFESMFSLFGQFPLGIYHKNRVNKTIQAFNLPQNLDLDKLFNEIYKGIDVFELQKVRVNFYIEDNQIQYEISYFTLSEDEVFPEKPVKLETFRSEFKEFNATSMFKVPNKVLYEDAVNYAQEHKLTQVVMLNPNQEVIETNIANIYGIRDGVIYTPHLESGRVEGVFMTFLRSQLEITNQVLRLDDLYKMDELFLTNAARGIMLVGSLDDQKYPIDKSRNLQAMIKSKLIG